ncbi:LacI family DNA-binding transcriptional regulator [Phytohabitans houttuyneae]|uniref:LacI family transcriptional regulator n=2 Tax=Phytohabitans houttuyneae TaxID=1076126 RepID=A0A6V8KGC4_9ACTN|nr:LacI family transcriptional regulator [Phytohabitans houttuyneae]
MAGKRPAADDGQAARAEGMVPVQPRGSVMRDVARLAGVSHQTVSRVLNEHPNVRQETRLRVLEAMQALNYRRNLAARTLVTRRSGTLGVVGLETTLFGPASMLYGIEDAARTAGYFVTVASVRTLERRSVLEAVDRLCQQSVEGIIAIAPKPAVTNALVQVPSGLASVGVGGGADDDAVPTVRIDNAAGARLATQHLLDLGHATVHHVAGPTDWPEARERIEGWRGTLYAAGAPVPPVEAGSWSAQSGYEQGQALARDPAVTAVFCGNDQIALGVLRALQEAGRRVPQDVSVVGFDDMPDSGYFLPPLTTIHQDFAELGRRSLGVLLDQIKQSDQRPPDHVLLSPELVVRASTAGPS